MEFQLMNMGFGVLVTFVAFAFPIVIVLWFIDKSIIKNHIWKIVLVVLLFSVFLNLNTYGPRVTLNKAVIPKVVEPTEKIESGKELIPYDDRWEKFSDHADTVQQRQDNDLKK